MNFKPQTSGGEGQLVTSYGVERFAADWNNPSHRGKRLLAEFLGVAGLMVILSGVAAILPRFVGANVPTYQLVAIAAVTSGAPVLGALAAVVVTQVFRGGSSAKEAAFALGAPEVMK